MALHRYKRRIKSQRASVECFLARFALFGIICEPTVIVKIWVKFLPEHEHVHINYHWMLLAYGDYFGPVRY